MDPPLIPQSTNPALLMNIGTVQITFGCSGATYKGSYDNVLAPHAQTIVTFSDTAMPCYSDSDVPVNKDTLDSLVERFAGDWLNWYNIQFDDVFDGICNVEPNGFIDEIELDHSSEMASTRIKSAPWNGWPTNLGHEDPRCPTLPSGIAMGYTTTPITAASGSTFGKGTAQVFTPRDSNAARLVTTLTVRNWFMTQVKINKHIMIAQVGCLWFVISADC